MSAFKNLVTPRHSAPSPVILNEVKNLLERSEEFKLNFALCGANFIWIFLSKQILAISHPPTHLSQRGFTSLRFPEYVNKKVL